MPRRSRPNPLRSIKYYKCEECGYTTTDMKEIIDHVQHAHDSKEISFLEITVKLGKNEIKKVIIGGLISA